MEDERLRKITIRLGETQLAQLKKLFPTSGYNLAIRTILDKYLTSKGQSNDGTLAASASQLDLG